MRALGLALLLSACTPGGKPYDYPLDHVLRLDEVQVKATHNSYHVETIDVPEWEYTMAPLAVQLDRQGVRGVELDLQWVGDARGGGHHFEVFHVTIGDEGTTCRLLTDCLRAVRAWSDRYPGHLPLYLELEPKPGYDPGALEDYFAVLEREVLSVFPRDRVLTPDELLGSAATIPAALANGWPTLDGLRGRVFFALDDHAEVRAAYTHGLADLRGRLLFVDSTPSDPYGAIAIHNDPADTVAIHAAQAAHLLVRTMSDDGGYEARANNTTHRDEALASGATWVSTDYPVTMGGLAYVVEIPGGTPARCNPVTASASCTPLALEDPRYVGSQNP